MKVLDVFLQFLCFQGLTRADLGTCTARLSVICDRWGFNWNLIPNCLLQLHRQTAIGFRPFSSQSAPDGDGSHKVPSHLLES